MSDKQLALEIVMEMPEAASLREIIDELLLVEEVRTRLAKSELGEGGVPHEEVAKMLDTWIPKSSVPRK